MRLKNIKTSKPDGDKRPLAKRKITLTDVSGMEQKIAEKTRQLHNTAQQIRELSDAVYSYDEDSIDELPMHHGPMIELHLDPDDQLIDPDIEGATDELVEPTENEEKETEIDPPIDTIDISSDVSAQELLNEIREIANIIKERHRG